MLHPVCTRKQQILAAVLMPGGTQAPTLSSEAVPGTAGVAEPHRQAASQGTLLQGQMHSPYRNGEMDIAPACFCPSDPYRGQGTFL